MEKLTVRQVQIFDLVARGAENAQIAVHPGVLEKTVRNTRVPRSSERIKGHV